MHALNHTVKNRYLSHGAEFVSDCHGQDKKFHIYITVQAVSFGIVLADFCL